MEQSSESDASAKVSGGAGRAWLAVALLGVGSCSLLAPSEAELVADSPAGGSAPDDGMAGGGAGGQGTHGDGSADAGDGCSGTLCGSDCVDTRADPENCGACARACAPGFGCELGQCGDEIVEVAAGVFSSCVVLRAGSVYCWGANQSGQLGDGSLAGTETCAQSNPCRPSAEPVMLNGSPLAGIAHVALSAWHACAVDQDGAVWCWGENGYGELGHAGGDPNCVTASAATTPCNPVPIRVGLPAGVRAIQVGLGLRYTCALTTGGDVYCWGRNNYGQLGLPLSVASTPVPTKVAGLSTPAVQLAVAIQGDVSGVLAEDGTMWCWGHNPQGVLGYDPAGDPSCGTSKCSFAPRPVLDDAGEPFSDASRLALGRSSGCALKDGGVWCWGGNGLGTLGTGTAGTAPRFAPASVPALSGIRSMAFSDFVVVATDASGASWSWGRNNFGTVGDGTVDALANGCQQACRPAPVRIDAEDLVQVSVSGPVLALDARGALWMWGENGSAQLGHLPGELGDLMCGTGAPTPAPCNPTPASVDWLP